MMNTFILKHMTLFNIRTDSIIRCNKSFLFSDVENGRKLSDIKHSLRSHPSAEHCEAVVPVHGLVLGRRDCGVGQEAVIKLLSLITSHDSCPSSNTVFLCCSYKHDTLTRHAEHPPHGPLSCFL